MHAPPQAEPRAASLRAARLAIRWAAMLAPLVWLSGRIDLPTLGAALRVVGLGPFALATASQATSILVGAFRWQALLRAYGAHGPGLPSVPRLFHHALVGTYYAMLPTGLVGEWVRAHRTTDALPKAGDAYVVALLDRVAGAVGLLACGGISFVAFPTAGMDGPMAASLRAIGWVVMGACVLLLGLPSALARSARLRSVVARIPRLGPGLAAFTPPARPGHLGVAFLASLVTQSLTVVTLLVLVRPLAPTVAASALFVPLTAIILATFLPITPGGIGQRELAFVAFLAPLSIDANRATAASIATMAMTFTLAAVGGLARALELVRTRAPTRTASSPRERP